MYLHTESSSGVCVVHRRVLQRTCSMNDGDVMCVVVFAYNMHYTSVIAVKQASE